MGKGLAAERCVTDLAPFPFSSARSLRSACVDAGAVCENMTQMESRRLLCSKFPIFLFFFSPSFHACDLASFSVAISKHARLLSE